MVIVTCTYLQLYIKVGVGVGRFLPTLDSVNIPSDSDSTALIETVRNAVNVFHTHSPPQPDSGYEVVFVTVAQTKRNNLRCLHKSYSILKIYIQVLMIHL
jgi:hypothetical protein